MPPAHHSALDPRTRRTRQLLQNGLRELLRQKPLDEILVQDITETATVNRATFYDHFADKFELFNALIAADFQKLLDQRNVCFDGSCTSGLAAVVLAVGDYLELLHQEQASCSRLASSGSLIDAAITRAIRAILLAGLEKQVHVSPVPREVAASLASGAIYGATKEWLSKSNWRADQTSLLSVVPLVLPLLEATTPPSRPVVKPRRGRQQ